MIPCARHQCKPTCSILSSWQFMIGPDGQRCVPSQGSLKQALNPYWYLSVATGQQVAYRYQSNPTG